MTNREQLIQELEQAPDDLVQAVLDFLHRAKATRASHPLAKFAGILSDDEAQELKQAIANCRQLDENEPTKYVEENFVVFLYLEEAATKEDFLYVFFHDDIKLWRTEGMNFNLTIPKYFYNREELKNRLLNREAITKIENILLKQAVNQLIKTNTSIIIDGIFIEKAVRKTQSFYKNYILTRYF